MDKRYACNLLYLDELGKKKVVELEEMERMVRRRICLSLLLIETCMACFEFVRLVGLDLSLYNSLYLKNLEVFTAFYIVDGLLFICCGFSVFCFKFESSKAQNIVVPYWLQTGNCL